MRWCALLVLLAAACGDDADPVDAGGLDAGANEDAGSDASAEDDAGGEAPEDAGGPSDAGPPPSACDLDAGPLPEVDAGVSDPPDPTSPELAGPGGPARSFGDDERLVRCASLDGGERDRDHHNTVLMLDGYLWMPWAHEAGEGAISVFEFDDPCAPVEVATEWHEQMRETHAAGVAYLGGRRYMVTASLGGIMFWDITDPEAIEMVHDMTLPGVEYPDSYARVVMSTFWQAPYVYVGASDNYVYVVDASDPAAPELVTQYVPEPSFRVGGVHAIGNLLVILPSEGTRTALADISLPGAPRPIPGGTWTTHDGTVDRFGRPQLRGAYFAHVNGDRIYYARHFLGGGLIVYDIADVTDPHFLGYREAPNPANGGYVYVKEGEAFVGLSNFGEVMNVEDPTEPTRSARVEMTGDLDTLVPVGNVIVASVDDDAVSGEATNIYPWKLEPDARAPLVNMVVPRDGSEGVALSSRIGVTLDEPFDLQSVHAGSFYVRPVAGGPPIAGWYSGQESVLNFWPERPLEPDTEYEVVLPAGGVVDGTGNPLGETFRSTFRTEPCG